jgi:hypothetical protein
VLSPVITLSVGHEAPYSCCILAQIVDIHWAQGEPVNPHLDVHPPRAGYALQLVHSHHCRNDFHGISLFVHGRTPEQVITSQRDHRHTVGEDF